MFSSLYFPNSIFSSHDKSKNRADNFIGPITALCSLENRHKNPPHNCDSPDNGQRHLCLTFNGSNGGRPNPDIWLSAEERVTLVASVLYQRNKRELFPGRDNCIFKALSSFARLYYCCFSQWGRYLSKNQVFIQALTDRVLHVFLCLSARELAFVFRTLKLNLPLFLKCTSHCFEYLELFLVSRITFYLS